uniref:Uncharacterized protein n=1 Tax=Glossina palpalis gambiensis TaxID=67801 RepID=A0A1B0C462_9MUSC
MNSDLGLNLYYIRITINQIVNGDSCLGPKATTVAGGRHTIIVKTCGALYGCDWNAHDQLGLTCARDFLDNLQYVDSISNDRNEFKVYCGTPKLGTLSEIELQSLKLRSKLFSPLVSVTLVKLEWLLELA